MVVDAEETSVRCSGDIKRRILTPIFNEPMLGTTKLHIDTDDLTAVVDALGKCAVFRIGERDVKVGKRIRWGLCEGKRAEERANHREQTNMMTSHWQSSMNRRRQRTIREMSLSPGRRGGERDSASVISILLREGSRGDISTMVNACKDRKEGNDCQYGILASVLLQDEG
jgi:hypothetical protein